MFVLVTKTMLFLVFLAHCQLTSGFTRLFLYSLHFFLGEPRFNIIQWRNILLLLNGQWNTHEEIVFLRVRFFSRPERNEPSSTSDTTIMMRVSSVCRQYTIYIYEAHSLSLSPHITRSIHGWKYVGGVFPLFYHSHTCYIRCVRVCLYVMLKRLATKTWRL